MIFQFKFEDLFIFKYLNLSEIFKYIAQYLFNGTLWYIMSWLNTVTLLVYFMLTVFALIKIFTTFKYFFFCFFFRLQVSARSVYLYE